MHSHKTYAHEKHAYETHAHEKYAHKTHAYEVHAHEVYPHEMCALEMHAGTALGNLRVSHLTNGGAVIGLSRFELQNTSFALRD
jgi:hypothetical protein